MDSSFDADIPITVEAFDQSSPSTSVLVTPGDWDFTSTSSSLVKRSNSSSRLWSKRGRQAFRRDSRPPNIKISAQHSVPQSPLTAPELDYEWAIPASSSPRRRSSSFRSHRPCSSISSHPGSTFLNIPDSNPVRRRSTSVPSELTADFCPLPRRPRSLAPRPSSLTSDSSFEDSQASGSLPADPLHQPPSYEPSPDPFDDIDALHVYSHLNSSASSLGSQLSHSSSLAHSASPDDNLVFDYQPPLSDPAPYQDNNIIDDDESAFASFFHDFMVDPSLHDPPAAPDNLSYHSSSPALPFDSPSPATTLDSFGVQTFSENQASIEPHPYSAFGSQPDSNTRSSFESDVPNTTSVQDTQSDPYAGGHGDTLTSSSDVRDIGPYHSPSPALPLVWSGVQDTQGNPYVATLGDTLASSSINPLATIKSDLLDASSYHSPSPAPPHVWSGFQDPQSDPYAGAPSGSNVPDATSYPSPSPAPSTTAIVWSGFQNIPEGAQDTNHSSSPVPPFESPSSANYWSNFAVLPFQDTQITTETHPPPPPPPCSQPHPSQNAFGKRREDCDFSLSAMLASQGVRRKSSAHTSSTILGGGGHPQQHQHQPHLKVGVPSRFLAGTSLSTTQVDPSHAHGVSASSPTSPSFEHHLAAVFPGGCFRTLVNRMADPSGSGSRSLHPFIPFHDPYPTSTASSSSSSSRAPPPPPASSSSSRRPTATSATSNATDPDFDSKLTIYTILINSSTLPDAHAKVDSLRSESRLKVVFDEAVKRKVKSTPAGQLRARDRRSREPTFSCILCEGMFTTNNNLQNHYRSHLQLDQYQCTRCGEFFRTEGIRKRHTNGAQKCKRLDDDDGH